MAQGKEFVERRHKRTMTKLVACFNRESGTRWDISAKSLASLI